MAAAAATAVDDCPPDETPTPTGGGGTPSPQGAGGTIWSWPNQQVVRADQSGPGVILSTGATAGAPGAWTPAGSQPPSTVADLQGGRPVTVTASPASAWTTGQYVQGSTGGAPGQMYWNSSAWVAGTAP
jgi:hypothetical protein